MDTKNPEKKEERLLTDEEKRMCADLKDTDLRTDEEIKQDKKEKGEKAQNTGEKIAELYKNQGNNFQEKTFRKVHKIATNPNKMAKKEYKWLIKGISEGRIYVGGDLGLNLFNSLVETIESGGDTEETKQKKSDLTERLKRIDEGIDSDFINNKPKAKEAIKKLRGEEEMEAAEEETQKEISQAANEIGEKAETMTKAPDSNYEEEQMPYELKEKLTEIDTKILKLYREEAKLSVELEAERKKDVPDISAINKKQKRIADIDDEIDKIRAEAAEFHQNESDFYERGLGRFNRTKFASNRGGLDIIKVKNLSTWYVKKDQDDPTEGLDINDVTGASTQRRQKIEVKRVYYEKEVTPLTEAASAGNLMVEYEVKEDGKKVKAESSYSNFLVLLDTMDGYEEIESADSFNSKYGLELGYKDVKNIEGNTFTRMNGEDSFTVEKVQGTRVILSQSVKKMPKELLSNSIDRRYYFDRHQKEFELGEFGVFLRKFDYRRDVSEAGLQEAVNKSIEASRKECESFTQGMTPDQKEIFAGIGGVPDDTLTVPHDGATQSVFYLENGKRREAQLRSIGGGEYELIYKVGYNDPGWRQPGVSTEPKTTAQEWEELSGAQPAAEMPVKSAEGAPEPAMAAVLPPSKGYTVQRKKLSGRNLVDMANKGDIQNAGAEEGTQLEPPSQDEGTPAQPPDGLDMPQGPKGDSGEDDSIKLYKPPYTKEALPYRDIVKVGGMQRVGQGLLKSFWANSRFLSVADLWEFGKAGWEYYDRRWQRKQKEKYSKVGENLPFWAPEFQRINQSAENEEMGQFKESFDQKGVHEIIERLQKTSNRDEMKAALTVLNEKGQMRWDDIDFWKNLNKFVDPAYAIPIPTNGDPSTEISKTDSRTGFDFLKDAIDSLWGEGQYNDWFRQHKSTYLSNAKSYYEKGKELEGVEGGPGRRLAVLLDMHKRGEFVDPHEYEGLILFSLDYGKASMQEKLYYMIEGVAAENMNGNTILSFDRMAHMNSEMLHKFPILEYLCATVPREDGGAHVFTVDDYKRWVSWFDGSDKMNNIPTKAVDEFLWKYAVPSDGTQNRINKDMRNGENLDHDDMFAFLPPASTGVVTDACKSTTGSKKFLTIEGYANVFPGFSQYFKSLSENNYVDKLVDAIKSYVRFEGIMTNKFEKAQTKAQDTYQRMDETTLNNATIVSDEPPSQFIRELNKIVQDVAAAYGSEELDQIINIIFNSPAVVDVTSSDGKARQNEINQAYYRFEEVFKGIISVDGGERMKNIVAGGNTAGMPYTTPAEKSRKKAALTS